MSTGFAFIMEGLEDVTANADHRAGRLRSGECQKTNVNVVRIGSLTADLIRHFRLRNKRVINSSTGEPTKGLLLVCRTALWANTLP